MTALDEIKRLRAEYGLGFTFNAGGGEFTHPSGWRCQIHAYDDEEDLAMLLRALKTFAKPKS